MSKREQLEESIRSATASVNLEFSQEVIDNCKPLSDLIDQFIIANDGSKEAFQAVDDVLMEKWRELHQK